MLAIVIPYYNFQFFEQTLKSLESQSDKRFNVYIGNDASPNSPESLIEKYSSVISIVYKKFETNLGQASLVQHWNRCIEMVREEIWVQILGDDDVLSENCIAEFYLAIESIEKEELNLIRFASQKIDAKGVLQSDVFQHPQYEFETASYLRYFYKETRSSLSEHVFRTTAYQQNGFQDFPLAWFSDTMAWLDFAEGKPIYTINNTTVFIRSSAVSITGKRDNMSLKYKAAYLFYRRLLKKHFSKFTTQQQEVLFKEFSNYVQVTRSYTWVNWRMIVWNALKKLDLETVIKITKKMFVGNGRREKKE